MQVATKQVLKSNRHGQKTGISNSEKINLSLRELKFESELLRYQRPKTAEEAVQMFIDLREQSLLTKYNQVFAFVQLQRFENFWKDYGCSSLSEWLATYDLPLGATLASREIMVRTFSKETFLLVGDEMLGEMMYLVANYQPDANKRGTDYQKILSAYSSKYSDFNKQNFREIVNWHINTTYITPTGKKVENVMAKPATKAAAGQTFYKKPETFKSEDGKTSFNEFRIEESLCAGCKARNAYIEKLEAVIKRECGAEFIPPRPQNIQ